jgi:hypothetical protein
VEFELFFCSTERPPLLTNTYTLSLSIDDIGSVVMDFGSASARLGHGGEESPSSCFPSYLGCSSDAPESAPGNHHAEMDLDPSGGGTSAKKHVTYSAIGDAQLGVWRPHMDIKSPLSSRVGELLFFFYSLFFLCGDSGIYSSMCHENTLPSTHLG